MKCGICKEKGVYQLPNNVLCKEHFIKYFEKKAYKTIKNHKLLDKNDVVCIAASGGKDSLSALYVTADYCKKKGIDFFALSIDEGIKDYRSSTIKDLQDFCEKYEIPLKVVSFKKVLGKDLDEVIDLAMKKYNNKPCTVCGILRRFFLNYFAKKFNSTKLVTGHNLDDESQAFMMNLFLGNMGHNSSLGPISGLSKDSSFVQRVKPLYFLTEKETRLYTLLKKFDVKYTECPYSNLSFRAKVRDSLNLIEDYRKGAKNGVVNSFLEILPELKKKYKEERTFSICETCGDACSGKICNACDLIDKLKLKWNPEQI